MYVFFSSFMFLFFKASYTAKLPARAKIVLKVSSVTLEDSHPEDKLVFTRIRKQNHVQSKKVFPFYLSSFFYGKHGSECQNGNFLRRICFLPDKRRAPLSHPSRGWAACLWRGEWECSSQRNGFVLALPERSILSVIV